MKVDPGLAARLIDQENRFGPRRGGPSDLMCMRGDGVYLWDLQGKRHLDFLAADSAANQGHNHPRIATAMVEQCLNLSVVSAECLHARFAPFLERLCTLSGYEAALPLTTGAEAVEAALRAARSWASRKGHPRGGILAFSGHGHALGAAPVTLAPYGDLAATREALESRTCAILVEPIQGEAGLAMPPRGFLRGLRDLCDSRDLLLLVDETTSGLGRTGKLFAFEHEGIRPDGLILGKSLSGGLYPVSAFLASREILDLLSPEEPRSTFAGSPLACAVATAALEVLTEERLTERAAELGAYFLARLRAMESPAIREVRGIGLWAALELRGPAGPSCEALGREGLLCRAVQDHVLLLCPPLVITREQLDWALEKLEKVLC